MDTYRNTSKLTIIFVFTSIFLLLLTGCPPRPPVVVITVTPTQATIDVGESILVSAESSDTNDIIVWSSSNNSIVSVTEAGLVLGISAGTASITATGSMSNASATVSIQVVEPEVWDPDTFVYDVSLAPDVNYVDESVLGMLSSYDEENRLYYFDLDQVQAYGWEFIEGEPLIVHGAGLGRILEIVETDNQIIIETDFISLTDIITEGEIAWDYGVEFTEEKIAAIEIPGKGIYYPTKGTPLEINLDVGNLNYLLKVNLDSKIATFDFTVSRSLAGPAGARFQAVGQLERFRSMDLIEIQGGALTTFEHQLNGLKGDVTLELVLAASGNDAVNLEFPVTIMRIPFMVGPIPVVLNIRIQFVVNAVVPLDGSAHVKTRFAYNSDLGLSCDGVAVEAGGRMGDTQFGDPIHQTGASSAIAANFGVGFPRVELSVAGNTLVPWAQVAFLVGGSYTFHPACQTADATFLGAAGYKLGFLGLNLLSGSKTLFREDKELLRAGSCPKNTYPLEYELIADSMMYDLFSSDYFIRN